MKGTDHVEVESLHRCSKRLRDLLHSVALQIGVSDGAFAILVSLYRNGQECRQRDLSEWTGRTKQTINSAITRLTNAGYVEVQDTGGREKLIHLTQSGNDFIDGNIRPVLDLETEVFASFSYEEREILKDLAYEYVSRYEQALTAYLKDNEKRK